MNETRDLVEELKERGERDKVTLTKANDAIGVAIERVVSVETNAQSLSVGIHKLKSDIDSVLLTDSKVLEVLDDELIIAEKNYNNTELGLEELRNEITELESTSRILTDRYDNLKLQRDLLEDMNNKLDKLDCENEF